MPHFLKLTKGLVQAVSIIITIAFLINSVNGALNAIKLADGNSIKPDSIAPGDFKIDYQDLYISVGLNFTNNGTYAIENIIVGLKFETKMGTGNWTMLLDNNTVSMNQASTKNGETINPGERKRIGIYAELPSFKLTPEEIQQYFNLNSNWNLKDLLALTNTTIKFDARLTLSFGISYAFGQYKIALQIVLETSILKGGFI
jgi:hypothetical protein